MKTTFNCLVWEVVPGDLRSIKICDEPGVYMLVTKKKFAKKPTIIYVGSAISLSRRIKNHEVRLSCKKTLKPPYRLYVYFHRCSENRLSLETSLIKQFLPKYNRTHNKSITKSYDESINPLNSRFSSWVVGKMRLRGSGITDTEFSKKKKMNSFNLKERAMIEDILGAKLPD